MPVCSKDRSKVLLSVKGFHQHTHECAVAAVAAVAHFYDPNITYKEAREHAPEHTQKEGLYGCEEAEILNKLGFSKVTIVSGDLSYFDLSWNKLTKRGRINKLTQMASYWARKPEDKDVTLIRQYRDWLKRKDCENDLIIDTEYPKYIRRYLRSGRPVLASFNWTGLFKKRKSGQGWKSDIKSDPDAHSVVIRGFDNKGIFIVDSHRQYYRDKLSRYRSGYYKLSWEKFLLHASGDDSEIILVS